jgi:hypothetical protein
VSLPFYITCQMPNCKFCNKSYKIEGTCLKKHESTCVQAAIKSSNIINASQTPMICPYCSKEYKSRRNDFEKHVKACSRQVIDHNDCLGDLFPFSDEFFIEYADFSEGNLLECEKDVTLFTDSISINKVNKFSIFHLNINSLFSKLHHISELITKAKPDVLCLNETKIDSSVPDSALHFYGYDILRRDRTARGGGVIIYVRKCYKILNSYTSPDFEFIHLKLSVGKDTLNIFACYKPPSDAAILFLDFLDSKINNLCPTDELFIVGDLNLDWLSERGSVLRESVVDIIFQM